MVLIMAEPSAPKPSSLLIGHEIAPMPVRLSFKAILLWVFFSRGSNRKTTEFGGSLTQIDTPVYPRMAEEVSPGLHPVCAVDGTILLQLLLPALAQIGSC